MNYLEGALARACYCLASHMDDVSEDTRVLLTRIGKRRNSRQVSEMPTRKVGEPAQRRGDTA